MNNLASHTVSRNVQCVPISTSVDAKKKTSTSTDVDCTKENEESLQDSSQLSKSSVKTHVQNINNVSQISSDFEFASDENSEISFSQLQVQ